MLGFSSLVSSLFIKRVSSDTGSSGPVIVRSACRTAQAPARSVAYSSANIKDVLAGYRGSLILRWGLMR